MNLAQLQKQWNSNELEKSRAHFPPAGSSPDSRIDIQHARLELLSGNPSVAIDILDQINQESVMMPAHLFRGVAHWDLGDFEKAEHEFRSVLSLQPSNNLAWSYLALTLYATGKLSEARSIWEEHEFSDNLLYRVRVTEYVERQWLLNDQFFSEPETPTTIQRKGVSERTALKYFYKRNFSRMLEYLPESPGANEFQNFLAAIGWEMLQRYSRAQQFVNSMAAKRNDWPDPLVALNARLLLRQRDITAAAAELAKVETMGYEDYAVNYFLGIVCLSYDNQQQARGFFIRAYGNYMIDTQEFQWAEIQRALLGKGHSAHN